MKDRFFRVYHNIVPWSDSLHNRVGVIMWLSTLATMKATNPASIDLTNGEFAHAKSRSHRLRNHYEQNAGTRPAPVVGS
jgi:hypothetical protein